MFTIIKGKDYSNMTIDEQRVQLRKDAIKEIAVNVAYGAILGAALMIGFYVTIQAIGMALPEVDENEVIDL